MPRRRLALLLEYDGTAFAGSQLQREQRTVQGALEGALREFCGNAVRAAFAGRTDTGVHALGQVAAVEVAAEHAAATVRRALNHFLPEDVAVRRVAEVGGDFDPRRDALGRVYRYEVEDGEGRRPLRRRRAWQLPHPLDAEAMAQATAALPREPRDWAAFAGPVPAGYPTVRTLQRGEVRRCGPHRLAVTMEANGFLPHQVRRTVGALERVGRGRLAVEEFARLIDGAPGSVGPAAPPLGLTLVRVRYPAGVVRWDTELLDRDVR